jgi:phospholipase C
VQNGDVPYFKSLADRYAMSDNFHQSVNGGTGANHIMLGHGDMIWFSDGKGHPTKPPENVEVARAPRTPAWSMRSRTRTPPGTNNWYTEDGYGGGSFGAPRYGGGSYSDCADTTQPGVAHRELPAVAAASDRSALRSGHYYLLNNYNPATSVTATTPSPTPTPTTRCSRFRPHRCPASATPCSAKNVSWKYYGDQWDNYVPDPYQLNYGAIGARGRVLQHLQSVPVRHLDHGQRGPSARRTSRTPPTCTRTLPRARCRPVSFVKPSGLVDGHPASSKLDLFEGFRQEDRRCGQGQSRAVEGHRHLHHLR